MQLGAGASPSHAAPSYRGSLSGRKGEETGGLGGARAGLRVFLANVTWPFYCRCTNRLKTEHTRTQRESCTWWYHSELWAKQRQKKWVQMKKKKKKKKQIVNLASIFFPPLLDREQRFHLPPSDWRSRASLVLAFIHHNKAKNVHAHVQVPLHLQRLPDRARPLRLMLIYDDTITMVTPAETAANLYVTGQPHVAASVCYSLTWTHCSHHSVLVA